MILLLNSVLELNGKAHKGCHQKITCGTMAPLGSSCRMGVPETEVRGGICYKYQLPNLTYPNLT
jgi:hypothetical protein